MWGVGRLRPSPSPDGPRLSAGGGGDCAMTMMNRLETSKPKGAADAKKKPANRQAHGMGLSLQRWSTTPGRDPFSEVEWELRTAAITDGAGKVYFEQTDVEIPKTWSQTATNVVAQKYFRGIVGTPQRERSVRQLISRVADTVTQWGKKGRYFASEDDVWTFRDELVHLLVHQKMAFNSPVWFNVGVETEPQC